MDADSALLKLHGLSWWDAIQAVKKEMGEDDFRKWISAKVRPWKVRMRVIEEMAWNDRNSDYNLFYDHIKKTRTYDDGSPVDVESVVVNLMSMLG